MDEFRKKPVNRLDQPVAEVTPVAASTEAEIEHVLPPIEGTPESVPTEKKPRKKRRIIVIASIILGALVLIFGAIFLWYQVQLTPVDAKATSKELITIESGTAPSDIAAALKDKNLIRDENAFLWYTRLTGTQNYLQAGTYRLSASESTPQIVDHLKNGTVDTFNITFLPGATLADNRKVFIDAGYSEEEVDTALAATYETPLFEGKPAGTDLEGYIYGNTYKFGSGATVEEILEHVFEVYYAFVQDNDLVAQYKEHGLSLFDGITLASIVQRESGGGDQAQIAQVFYSRLDQGISLGSDVTYQYIADKTGVPRDPNLDSPYNTRVHTGLPPGPIAVPGNAALLAVANPADTDYLFFLSGDDDVTYFGRTQADHEANIVNHCKEKCKIL